MFFSASLVAESSKNTKWILCSVKLSNQTNCGGDARERRVEQRAVGQEHRAEQDDEDTSASATHFVAPKPDESRVALLAADDRIAAAAEDRLLGRAAAAR